MTASTPVSAGDADGDQGDRIEALLTELRATADPATASRVDELVKRLIDLYGAGLARVVAIVGPERAGDLARDDLLSALLVVHGLHPDPVRVRVEAALARIRPGLASRAASVELVGVEGDGVARVQVRAARDGCSSSRAELHAALEQVIREAAPELTRVEIVAAPELIQLHKRDR